MQSRFSAFKTILTQLSLSTALTEMPLELKRVFELFILSAAKPGCAMVFMTSTHSYKSHLQLFSTHIDVCFTRARGENFVCTKLNI